FPFPDVEAGVLGILLELIGAEFALILEQKIVQLPEFALLRRGYGGLGRRHRIGMHGGRQRELLVREIDVLGIRLQYLVYDTGRLGAERTLEVRALSDRYLCRL